MEKHDRLKQARTLAGFKSAAAAAARLKIPYGTYSGHENGSRGIKDEELKLYAQAFRVSLDYLAFGRTSDFTIKFPIVGTIYNGGVIDVVKEGENVSGEDDLFIEQLPIHWIKTNSFLAYKIEARDMAPGLNPGEFILCWPQKRTDIGSFSTAFNVIHTVSGETYYRRLYDTPTGYDLLTHPGARPLAGVQIAWARRVCLVLKAEFLTGPISRVSLPIPDSLPDQ